jgi:hypothetical protein
MTVDEYMKQNNIPEDKRLDAIWDFIEQKYECSCLLPPNTANRLDNILQEEKDRCLKKYPQ